MICGDGEKNKFTLLGFMKSALSETQRISGASKESVPLEMKNGIQTTGRPHQPIQI